MTRYQSTPTRPPTPPPTVTDHAARLADLLDAIERRDVEGRVIGFSSDPARVYMAWRRAREVMPSEQDIAARMESRIRNLAGAQ